MPREAATGAAIAAAAGALLAVGWGAAARSLVALALTAVVLDAAVQTNQVIGQRAIYSLNAEARGRLTAAHMTVVFLCGALGSALGSLTYVGGGWWTVALTGAGIAAAALVLFATELVSS